MTEQLGDSVLDTSIELFEVIGDQVFDDGLIKDLPILGTAVNLARVGRNIRDRIFLKKIEKFIFSLSKIEEIERQKFYNQLEKNPKLKQRMGEVLVLILDRLDDLEKPKILAKAFTAYIKGYINFDQFRKLSSAIDLAYIEDLQQLVNSKRYSTTDMLDFQQGLLRTGLTAISHGAISGQSFFGEDVVYLPITTTALGELFIEIMTDKL
ncbi:MAG: hypothetical protein SFY66_02805 [Oculatellaceae cyanobacterium bins.114]|nr:hypothetical protein [Oculatellaceae cyanobacterium bins.114]